MTEKEKDNLSVILAGFDGSMTVIAGSISAYGGTPGKIFGATFSVTNGIISGAISYGSSSQEMANLEQAALGAGITTAVTLTASLFVAAPVLIVIGAVTAVVVAIYGDEIYEGYIGAQQALFDWMVDNDITSLNDIFVTLGQEAGEALADLLGQIGMELGDLIDGISAEINELWEQAQNWVRPHDPLVLDLDGDGVETFGITADTQVLFDSNGNGIKTATGWVSSDDGILVFDRNGNGLIDNGSELFGDQTVVNGIKAKDGFEALRAEDTNGNGLFDAGDANFANVRVWRDFNGDGISNEGELFSLSELGIASIDLESNATSSSSNGNVTTATGSYTKTDGSTYDIGNLNFISNTFYSEFIDAIELDDTALSLPNVHGSGMIRDLQEASMLSDNLTQTVQDMQEQGYVSKDVFMEQVDALVAQWAQTSTMQSSIEKAEELQNKTLVYLPSTSSSDMRL
ncbi:MAG: hypothetical protein JXQ68_03555, partial [Campylobacterales bacterium]|nr:hypothetical protein [Campylobacterales bacterium]